MAVITFSNTAVDMRLVNDSFGIAPMQTAYDLLSSYSPIDAYAVTSSSSYMQLRAYDSAYNYTNVHLWLTGQSSTSITLSKMALEIEETGFHTSITGSMTINDSASFWGTVTGVAVQNVDTGITYFTASGLNLYLSGNAFGSIDPTPSLATNLSGSDSIKGGAYSDYLLAYGGNDTIDGGAGNDTMVGGTGNDTFYVRQSGDVVKENAGEGTDSVYSYLTSDTLDSYVENGVIKLAAAANLTGNSSANTLTGNAYANILNGNSGADTMLGGIGNDTYYVDNTGDKVYETTTTTNTTDAGGTDLIVSSVTFNLSTYTGATFVENLRLNSSNAINGAGNALNNTLYAGAGNNTIDGLGGTDTVSYAYTTAGVTLSLANTTTAQVTGGSGSDLVRNVENISGSGYGDKLTGSSVSNILSGGNGADTLSGAAGNDKLYGGAGNDSMTGGTGSTSADTFVFNTSLASNIDKITDFEAAYDTIQLENAIFTMLTATGTLNADFFNSYTSTSSAAPILANYGSDGADNYIQYNRTTGALYYDADGSGTTSSAVQLAIIGTSTHAALTAGDFMVI